MYRTLDARTSFFYFATGATPAMSMNLTGIGSQYLMITVDANKEYFDGSKTYKVTLPKGIPQERFWSFTVYDNQTRSFLDTPQTVPAGRRPELSVACRRTGRRRIHDGLLRTNTACRRQTWQLGPDRSEERLVHDPAAL